MDAVAARHSFEEVGFTGVLRSIDEIDAGLVDGYGVEGSKYAYIPYLRVLGDGAAIAVNRHIRHNMYECDPSGQSVHDGFCGIRHAFKESIMIGSPDLFGVACAMDMGFTVRGCYAY